MINGLRRAPGATPARSLARASRGRDLVTVVLHGRLETASMAADQAASANRSSTRRWCGPGGQGPAIRHRRTSDSSIGATVDRASAFTTN